MDVVTGVTRELGDFLRSRRERTRPEELGLEPGSRRRVSGLRREEVAALAGLSTDYYQRLEQGRGARPSDAVLDSIADALDFDEADRDHLMGLGRAARLPARTRRSVRDRLPPRVQALLDATALPALAVSRFLDVLAWNDLAAELFGDPAAVAPGERNILAAVLSDESSCGPHTDGEAAARDYIGLLRAAVAHAPEDPRAVAVVGALSVRSEAFRRLWARHDVRSSVHGTHVVRHPRVGPIALEWDSYPLGGSPGPMLIVFTPRPGHEDRLRLVSAVAMTEMPWPHV